MGNLLMAKDLIATWWIGFSDGSSPLPIENAPPEIKTISGVSGAAIGTMACSANLAFATYPLLSAGAAASTAHGSAEQVARYVPRLASGEWTCTMCLTEPQAGTDLGILRTRAAPAGAGRTSTAPRYSSAGATTTWRTTSSTSCSRGCPTRRRGRRA